MHIGIGPFHKLDVAFAVESITQALDDYIRPTKPKYAFLLDRILLFEIL